MKDEIEQFSPFITGSLIAHSNPKDTTSYKSVLVEISCILL